MIECYGCSKTEEMAGIYEEIRKILKEIETEPIRIGTWRIDDVIPRSRDLLRKQLNVRLLELRAEIRGQLDQDEREQLKMPEPAEEKTEEPAAGIPKNDYRRHRTEAKRMAGND